MDYVKIVAKRLPIARFFPSLRHPRTRNGITSDPAAMLDPEGSIAVMLLQLSYLLLGFSLAN